jgi:hypothetical protein
MEQAITRRTGLRAVVPDVRPGTAVGTTVRVFGVLAAVAGTEHGVGEIAQGWKEPPGLVVESWPETRAFESLDGEPAMTLVPNLVLSGIAAVVLSVALGAWCLAWPRHRRSSLVITALSVVLLLVGGGFGPPLVGALLALGARRIAPPHPARPTRRSARWSTQTWGRLWQGALVLGVAGFLVLLPGMLLLSLVTLSDGNGLLPAAGSVTAFVGLIVALVSARFLDRTTGLQPR